jgi:hypothetical protein
MSGLSHGISAAETVEPRNVIAMTSTASSV